MSIILTRRPNESVHIGSDIVVTVMSVNGSQVRLSISAPNNMVVDRAEIAAKRAADGVPHLPKVAS